MIEINLMPDVKQELLRAQRVRSTVISFAILVGIIAAAIVTILTVYVFGVQTVRSGIADKAIEDGNTELMQATDLSKTLTIQNQLSVMSDINAQKKLHSRLFDLLNATVPTGANEVTISRLILDSTEGVDSITIEGQAVGSYPAAELFKKTLESAVVRYTDESGEEQEVELASNVNLSETSYGEDQNGAMTLRFTISFEYASELFAASSDNVRISIARTGNVTDSYLGIPRSIFADRADDIEGEE